MAGLFTLPELRAELHSLGHDDVPDHVILSFLSQLHITIPNCFRGHSSGKCSDGDGDAGSGGVCAEAQHIWKQLDLLDCGRRNVRFESQTARSRRPDTPPRGNPAYSSSSDSEASKENDRCGTWSQQSNQPLRQVLQPRDNLVSAGDAEGVIGKKYRHRKIDEEHQQQQQQDDDEYLYPGDLLVHLKEQHRPGSCPSREFNRGSFIEELSVRSLSAGDCHRVEVSDFSSAYSKDTASGTTSANTSSHYRDVHRQRYFCQQHRHEVQTNGSSLCSFDEDEAMGKFSSLHLKPLNVGVVKQHLTSNSSRASEDGSSVIEESSQESPKSNCAACIFLESRPAKYKQFSINCKRNGNGDGEKSRGPSPFSCIEDTEENDTSPENTNRVRFCTESLRRISMIRKGKIDRVARFAAMQRVWSRDNFLQGNWRRKKQSFHRMFAEIHASNEREYAASRARSVLGIRDEQELPPFVLTP